MSNKIKCKECHNKGFKTIEICLGCGQDMSLKRDCGCPCGAGSLDIPCGICNPKNKLKLKLNPPDDNINVMKYVLKRG